MSDNILPFIDFDTVVDGSPITANDPATVTDEDTTTFIGSQNSEKVGCWIRAAITFDHVIPYVDKVHILSQSRATSTAQAARLIVTVQYDDDSTEEIANLTRNAKSWTGSVPLFDDAIEGIWHHVKKITVYVRTFPNVNHAHSLARIHEVYVHGSVFVDSGIHVYDGTAVVKVGSHLTETGLDDGLKVQTASGVKNIGLVDTDSPFASPLRFYTGTATKAIAKVIE